MQVASPPAWFAAFALCAVPAVIYLIFRRRRKDIAWGAVYILRRLLEAKSRTSAWKQYAVIALRTVAFAALAFAFARPHLLWKAPSDGSFPIAPPGTHRFVLVDVSSSMDARAGGAGSGGGTRMDAAFSLCRKAMEAARFPGRLDVLPMDGRDKPFTLEPQVKAASIEETIARMQRSRLPADLEKGMQAAIVAFRSSPFERRELFILSDFSAADLGEPERLSGPFRTLQRLNVRVCCLTYATPDAANFAIHEMTPQMDVLLAGQATIFHVTVGYYGAAQEADTWLTIRDGRGNALFEDALSLAPSTRTLEVPLTLPAGDHILTATLKEDDHPADNVLSRSFRVVPDLRVVVLQETDLSTGFENPREWLTQAMTSAAPTAEAGHQPASRKPWTVDYVNSAQIGPDILSDRDAAIFLDVDTLDSDGLEAARLFAVRGGTILLAPGPTADPAKFNESFASLSPARLRSPQAGEVNPDTYQSAVLEKADDLLLREMESPGHGNIGNARFYRWFETEQGSLASDAEVLFSLSGGSPLCVFRPIGRGGCLLWTAGLGMDWHSMVVHPSYPVFFSRLLNVAAARRQFARNLQPGQPLISEVAKPECTLVRPGGEKVPLTAVTVSGKLLVRYDRTDSAGTYTLLPDREEQARGTLYTVREDRRESDYRTLDDDRVRSLERQTGSGLCRTETELFAALGRGYAGKSLMTHAAVLLLVALLAEAGLARRWFA